jgi:uncharacterized protein YqjF (DUF2071 family)
MRMSIQNVSSQLMVKEMVFKSENQGTSKKNGRDYHMIELHDPVSLDNINLFIRPENPVSTNGIQFKDKVTAYFGMEFIFGKPQMVLQSLTKK